MNVLIEKDLPVIGTKISDLEFELITRPHRRQGEITGLNLPNHLA